MQNQPIQSETLSKLILIASAILLLWHFTGIDISKIQQIKDIGINDQKLTSYILVTIIFICIPFKLLELTSTENQSNQSIIQFIGLTATSISAIVISYPKIVENTLLNETDRLDLTIPVVTSIIASLFSNLICIGTSAILAFYKTNNKPPQKAVATLFISSCTVALSIYLNFLIENKNSDESTIFRCIIFLYFFLITFTLIRPNKEIFTKQALQELSKASDSTERSNEIKEISKSIEELIPKNNRTSHKKIMRIIENQKKSADKITPRFQVISDLEFSHKDGFIQLRSKKTQDEENAIEIDFINQRNGISVQKTLIKYKYIKAACHEGIKIIPGNDINPALTALVLRANELRALQEDDPNELILQLSENDRNLPILKILLKNRAPNINYRSHNGWTPLLTAVANGQFETTRFLLQKAANPLSSTKFGYSSLHFASKYGDIDLCTLLIDYHADVDQLNTNGSTPLMLAAEHGHGAIVKLLLEKGATASLTNKNNKNAIDYALEGNYGDICKMIRSHINQNSTKP